MNISLIKRIYLRAYSNIEWKMNAITTKKSHLTMGNVIELYNSDDNNIILYRNKLYEHFNYTNNVYQLDDTD